MQKVKQLGRSVQLVLFIIFLIVIMVVLINIHGYSKIIGEEIGNLNGQLVGTAIGSAKGVTEGVASGITAGEEAGLSAVDTTADIKGTIESMGKLEVLVAGVTLQNLNEIGDAYKGLYIANGDAVFTVDLNEAEISFSQDDKDVYITIPAPEFELYLDQNSTEKLFEIQNFSFTVDAEDGINSYLNTMTKTVEKAKETIVNYDSLMTTATESAKQQVEQLASTVCGEEHVVHVQFR